MVSLDAAKAARDKVLGLLEDAEDVTGVGVVRTVDGYGVRVNLLRPDRTMPDTIDGVNVSTRITGRLQAHLL